LKIIVDISDARVSKDPGDELVTYSLGSCIGVAVHDPVARIGGMLHYQLPSDRADSAKTDKNPLMFADTGMKYLIDKMMALGVNKRQLKVKIAGGAQMNDAKTFQIGKRNYAAIRQVLWKNGMFIDAEDVGGHNARNLSLQISDGTVQVKSQGNTKQL
jgi:chemotaxis protein CheD